MSLYRVQPRPGAIAGWSIRDPSEQWDQIVYGLYWPPAQGTSAATIAAPTQSASGGAIVSGDAASSITVASSASALVVVAGTSAASVSLAASGTGLVLETATGTSAGTLPPLTQSAAGWQGSPAPTDETLTVAVDAAYARAVIDACSADAALEASYARAAVDTCAASVAVDPTYARVVVQ